MADEAISYLKGLNAASPEKPFFLYYVPGGTPSPDAGVDQEDQRPAPVRQRLE